MATASTATSTSIWGARGTRVTKRKMMNGTARGFTLVSLRRYVGWEGCWGGGVRAVDVLNPESLAAAGVGGGSFVDAPNAKSINADEVAWLKLSLAMQLDDNPSNKIKAK